VSIAEGLNVCATIKRPGNLSKGIEFGNPVTTAFYRITAKQHEFLQNIDESNG
jgi:hypothetical protein